MSAILFYTRGCGQLVLSNFSGERSADVEQEAAFTTFTFSPCYWRLLWQVVCDRDVLLDTSP